MIIVYELERSWLSWVPGICARAFCWRISSQVETALWPLEAARISSHRELGLDAFDCVGGEGEEGEAGSGDDRGLDGSPSKDDSTVSETKSGFSPSEDEGSQIACVSWRHFRKSYIWTHPNKPLAHSFVCERGWPCQHLEGCLGPPKVNLFVELLLTESIVLQQQMR